MANGVRWMVRGGLRIWAAASLVVALAAAAQTDSRLATLSDAPDPAFIRTAATSDHATYRDALAAWRSAEDINAWLGASFRYDAARAMALSETARASGAPVAIVEPDRFFAAPVGVCVDLARFAVSSLREVDANAQAAYLMIEFEPVQVSGQTLRRHWMAVFKREGKFHFFADSKRPGYMAGPYDSVETFLADYGDYRGRRIVGFRLSESYQRRMRTLAPKADRSSGRF